MKNPLLHHFLAAGIAALFMLNISACNIINDGSGNSPQVELTLDKAEIVPSEAFNMSLSVYNPSSKMMTFHTSCEAFANLFTYKEDDLVDFINSDTGCLRRINTYEIKPGETLAFSWDLEAVVLSWNPDTNSVDSADAAPGEYVVQVRLNTSEEKLDKEYEKTLLIQ